MDKDNGKMKEAKYLLLAGIIAAIGIPILAMLGVFLSVWTWLVPVLGLAYGVLGLSDKKANVKVLLSGITLLLIGAVFASVPMLGALLNSIFGNMALLAGGVIAIPAVKEMYKLATKGK